MRFDSARCRWHGAGGISPPDTRQAVFSRRTAPAARCLAFRRASLGAMTVAMWMRAICRYRSVSAILRLWSLVRVGSFQMDLRMYAAKQPRRNGPRPTSASHHNQSRSCAVSRQAAAGSICLTLQDGTWLHGQPEGNKRLDLRMYALLVAKHIMRRVKGVVKWMGMWSALYR